MIYQFKVTLKDLGVPVWRKIQVDSEMSFEELHYVIQVTFDWANSHLHHFAIIKSNGKKVARTFIEPVIEDFFDGPSFSGSPMVKLDEKEEQLSTWFKKEKDEVIYRYDFGEDWEHSVVLEKILEPASDVSYPICLKAKNESPHEDSRWEITENPDLLVYSNGKEIATEINSELDGWKNFGPDYWKIHG